MVTVLASEAFCPFRNAKTGCCPCNHKNWNNGKRKQGCTKFKANPDDYRLSIDREGSRFKRAYVMRTECKRYNSRFKASGRESLFVRNGNSVANLNTLAHISALSVALADRPVQLPAILTLRHIP